MRLALFWPAQVYKDTDGYITNGHAHQWFGPLAEHFTSLDLIARRSPSRIGVARLETSRIRVHLLPPVEKSWQTYTVRLPLIVFAMIRLIITHRRYWDRVMVYEAAPLAQVWYGLCRIAGLPVVLYLGGRHEQAVITRTVGRNPVVRLLARGWSRWCRMAIPWMVRHTPTVVTGRELEEFYQPVSRRRIQSIISSSVRESQLVTSAVQRSQTGENVAVPIILTVCTLSAVKGVEYILQAAHNLAQRGCPTRVRIVGSGQEAYIRQLQQLAKDYGIDDDVEFVGAIAPGPPLLPYYDGADVFVLASTTEGTPKVILEAMSRGVPVVATNVGAVPELVDDGRTGLLVPARDAAALADAIQRVLDDPDLATRLAEQALNTVRELTVEAQTARLATVLKNGAVASDESIPGGSERIVFP